MRNSSASLWKNSYAAQTAVGYRRRAQAAYYLNTFEIPGQPFNKCMTFPCEMTLKSENNELTLCTNPIKEIEKLYKTTYHLKTLHSPQKACFRTLCRMNAMISRLN